MANETKYYVRCEMGCKHEAMSKEQTLTAITQAVETGEIKDVDTGFVTKIKEQNAGAALTFWVGTQAQYNAITEKAQNCFYVITDDTTKADVDAAIIDLEKQIEAIGEEIKAGDEVLFNSAESGAPLPFGGLLTKVNKIGQRRFYRVVASGNMLNVECLCHLKIYDDNGVKRFKLYGAGGATGEFITADSTFLFESGFIQLTGTFDSETGVATIENNNSRAVITECSIDDVIVKQQAVKLQIVEIAAIM